MGGRSYSQDLRSRVLALDDLSARQAAARFKVSVSYVIKARQRRDRTGEIGTRPRGLAGCLFWPPTVPRLRRRWLDTRRSRWPICGHGLDVSTASRSA